MKKNNENIFKKLNNKINSNKTLGKNICRVRLFDLLWIILLVIILILIIPNANKLNQLNHNRKKSSFDNDKSVSVNRKIVEVPEEHKNDILEFSDPDFESTAKSSISVSLEFEGVDVVDPNYKLTLGDAYKVKFINLTQKQDNIKKMEDGRYSYDLNTSEIKSIDSLKYFKNIEGLTTYIRSDQMAEELINAKLNNLNELEIILDNNYNSLEFLKEMDQVERLVIVRPSGKLDITPLLEMDNLFCVQFDQCDNIQFSNTLFDLINKGISVEVHQGRWYEQW